MCILHIRFKRSNFPVIDVDIELRGLANIHDKAVPGVIPVTPAQAGRNGVLLMVHHHRDVGAVIMRTDRFVSREGKKNRVLVDTILVRIFRTVDGKYLTAGVRHVVFRIALTVYGSVQELHGAVFSP